MKKIVLPLLVALFPLLPLGAQRRSAAPLTAEELASRATSTQTRATQTLPFVEDFENLSTANAYGVPLPTGWSVDGDMRCGYMQGMPAKSGNYYAFSNYDSYASRDEWMFTSTLSLEAGKSYAVSVYVNVPGYNNNNDEFRVTVGAAATKAAQTTVVIDKSGSNSISTGDYDWVKVAGTFSPDSTGNYTFALNHCTVPKDVNMISFDLFEVSEVELAAPVAAFESSATEVPLGTAIEFIDRSTGNPTAWSWNFFGEDSEPYESESGIIRYEEAGVYDVSLAVSNALGSDTILKEDYIVVSDKGITQYPYVDNLADNLVASCWTGTGDWELVANEDGSHYYMTLGNDPAGGDSFMASRPFYFEAGVEYRVRIYLGIIGVGGGAIDVALLQRNEEGGYEYANRSSLFTYTSTMTVDEQYARINVAKSGNYNIGIVPSQLQMGTSAVFMKMVVEIPEITSEEVKQIVPTLAATCEDGIVELTFGVPADALTPQGYCIFRNSEYVTSTYGNSYQDILLSSGDYTYQVAAVYDGDALSALSEAVTVTYDAFAGVGESQLDATRVEAGKGVIRIQSAVGSPVTVTTLEGRLVASTTLQSGSEEMALEAGFYLVTVGTNSYKVAVR